MEFTQWRFKQLQGLHVLREPPALRILVLDISEVCNFNCQYCYGQAESFRGHEGRRLDRQDYFQLIKEAKDFGVQTIWFLGSRENTLSPNYLQLLAEIQLLGLYSVTFTNGAAFGDDSIANKVFGLSAKQVCLAVAAHPGSSVVLKCDSLTAEVQNRLAGNENAYVQIKKAIENFLCTSLWSVGNSGFNRFGLNSVLTKVNYRDVATVFRFAMENHLAYFCDALLMSGSAKDSLSLTPEQRKVTLADFSSVLTDYGINIAPKSMVNFYDQPCILFSNFIFVTPFGNVVPCAGFPEKEAVLGSVSEGLAVLWSRKKAQIAKYQTCLANHDKCPCRVHLEDGLF